MLIGYLLKIYLYTEGNRLNWFGVAHAQEIFIYIFFFLSIYLQH